MTKGSTLKVNGERVASIERMSNLQKAVSRRVAIRHISGEPVQEREALKDPDQIDLDLSDVADEGGALLRAAQKDPADIEIETDGSAYHVKARVAQMVEMGEGLRVTLSLMGEATKTQRDD